MCTKCFDHETNINKLAPASLELAILHMSKAVKQGYLPLMCKQHTGEYFVCYEESQNIARRQDDPASAVNLCC